MEILNVQRPGLCKNSTWFFTMCVCVCIDRWRGFTTLYKSLSKWLCLGKPAGTEGCASFPSHDRTRRPPFHSMWRGDGDGRVRRKRKGIQAMRKCVGKVRKERNMKNRCFSYFVCFFHSILFVLYSLSSRQEKPHCSPRWVRGWMFWVSNALDEWALAG